MNVDTANDKISNTSAAGMVDLKSFKVWHDSLKQLQKNSFVDDKTRQELIKNLKKLKNISFRVDLSANLKTQLRNYIQDLLNEVTNLNERSGPSVRGKLSNINNFFSSITRKLPMVIQAQSVVNKIRQIFDRIF